MSGGRAHGRRGARYPPCRRPGRREDGARHGARRRPERHAARRPPRRPWRPRPHRRPGGQRPASRRGRPRPRAGRRAATTWCAAVPTTTCSSAARARTAWRAAPATTPSRPPTARATCSSAGRAGTPSRPTAWIASARTARCRTGWSSPPPGRGAARSATSAGACSAHRCACAMLTYGTDGRAAAGARRGLAVRGLDRRLPERGDGLPAGADAGSNCDGAVRAAPGARQRRADRRWRRRRDHLAAADRLRGDVLGQRRLGGLADAHRGLPRPGCGRVRGLERRLRRHRPRLRAGGPRRRAGLGGVRAGAARARTAAATVDRRTADRRDGHQRAGRHRLRTGHGRHGLRGGLRARDGRHVDRDAVQRSGAHGLDRRVRGADHAHLLGIHDRGRSGRGDVQRRAHATRRSGGRRQPARPGRRLPRGAAAHQLPGHLRGGLRRGRGGAAAGSIRAWCASTGPRAARRWEARRRPPGDATRR